MRSDPNEIHASDVHTFRLCRRKYVFSKQPGATSEGTAATDFGTRFHDRAEKYLHTRTIENPSDDVGLLLAKGIHLLPDYPVRTEVGFDWTSPRGIHYAGRADWMGMAFLGDHKTCAEPRWAKDEATLRNDPQVLLYGTVFLKTAFQWTYFPRRSGQPFVVSWKMTEGELSEGFDRLEDEAMEMLATPRNPLQVIGNPEACEAYGGCPHYRTCYPTMGHILSRTPYMESSNG